MTTKQFFRKDLMFLQIMLETIKTYNFCLTEKVYMDRMEKRNKLFKTKLKKERNYSMCMSREGS